MPVKDQTAAACAGKIAFATPTGAFIAAKRMTKRRKFAPRRGEVIRPYRCKFCTQWHIGGTGKDL